MSANRSTECAPHIRASIDLRHIQRTQAFALSPVVIAALLNTGYQYLLALNANAGASPGGWRDRVIQSFGIDFQDPSVTGALLAGLVHIVPILLVAVVSAGLCERAFSTKRDRPMESGFLVVALVFTLLLPPNASLVHVALGMIFAIVFGKGVFGGDGKTFLNPALLGVAVVQISFPTSGSGHPLWTGIEGYAGVDIFYRYHQHGEAALAWAGIDWWSAFIGVEQGLIGTTSVLAALLGGAVLVFRRIASWRLICAQVAGLVTMVWVGNAIGGGGVMDLPWYWHLLLGNFAFGAIFIATDPSSSAGTDVGRWVQGVLMGGLVVMIRFLNESHPDGAVAALLLGSVLAPLIDQIVVWFNVRQRAGRCG